MWRHILPNAMVATLTYPAVHPVRLGDHAVDAWIFSASACRPDRPRSANWWRRRRSNLQAPWLGFTAFFVLGGVLTLLIFVGEAVRDAFDPRRLPV